MRNQTLCLLLLWLVGCSPPSLFPSTPLEVSFPNATTRSHTVEDLSRHLEVATVKVDADPIYGKPKTFRGFWLRDLMEFYGQQEAVEVVFHCRDKFAAATPVEAFQDGQVLLAFGDETGASLENYSGALALKKRRQDLVQALRFAKEQGLMERHRKATEELDQVAGIEKEFQKLGNPGPFYPVFVGDPPEQWLSPQAVASLEFRSGRTELENPASRGASSQIQLGKDLFQSQCMACHSVGGPGGTVGPDLNTPRNVTEYFHEDAIREMLRGPQQFRKNAKMTLLRPLEENEIEALVAYLKWLAAQKERSPVT